MVELLQQRVPLSQRELIERHQRSLAEIIPGDDRTVGKVRERLADLGFREDDVLTGWEIQDALVPGRFEELRNEGYVILSPNDVGMPALHTKLPIQFVINIVSDKEIATSIAQGQPLIATLTETENEFFRHAYVIVGITFPDGSDYASEFQLLDPLSGPEVVVISGDEFRRRVRTVTHEERVRAEYDFCDRLIRAKNLSPGFYIRNPADNPETIVDIGWLIGIPNPIASVLWEDTITERVAPLVASPMETQP